MDPNLRQPESDTQRANKIKARYEKMQAEKFRWLPTWFLIGLYVQPAMQYIMGQMPQGQVLTSRMFDATAAKSAQKAASATIGAIWPSGPRSFYIGPPDDMPAKIAKSAAVKAWYEYCSQCMYSRMDDPRLGLMVALDQYMYDQYAIGTSGIFVEENFGIDEKERPFFFHNLDCKRICIAEGPDGFVDTIYIERHYTPKQAVQMYGINNVSKTVYDKFKVSDTQNTEIDKVRVLHAIEPRIEGVPGLFGNNQMPFASCHIELDTLKILRESGYEEKPGFVTRFWKMTHEVYGRCPSSENMPDIIEVNQRREAAIIATEKHLNPPIILHNDGSFGGGVFDTSANAVNIREASGRMSEQGKMVEQIYDTGPIAETEERIVQLQESIKDGYFENRFVGPDKETRMTLGEANMLDERRGLSLVTTYARQIAELFNPLTMRCFHIMLGKGLFGLARGSDEWNYQYAVTGQAPMTIPDEIVALMMSGQKFYKCHFIGPAMRIMRNEQLRGMESLMQTIQNVGAVAPEIKNIVNYYRYGQKMAEITGAPMEVLNTTEEMDQIAAAQQQAQSQAAADSQSEQHSLTAKHYAQAAKSAADAGLNPLALIQGGQQGAA